MEKKHFLRSLEGTAENRVVLQIPVESDVYQAFLVANRNRELAREENGGPDPKAEAAYLEAVKKVVELGKTLYVGDRSTST